MKNNIISSLCLGVLISFPISVAASEYEPSPAFSPLYQSRFKTAIEKIALSYDFIGL